MYERVAHSEAACNKLGVRYAYKFDGDGRQRFVDRKLLQVSVILFQVNFFPQKILVLLVLADQKLGDHPVEVLLGHTVLLGLKVYRER